MAGLWPTRSAALGFHRHSVCRVCRVCRGSGLRFPTGPPVHRCLQLDKLPRERSHLVSMRLQALNVQPTHQSDSMYRYNGSVQLQFDRQCKHANLGFILSTSGPLGVKAPSLNGNISREENIFEILQFISGRNVRDWLCSAGSTVSSTSPSCLLVGR